MTDRLTTKDEGLIIARDDEDDAAIVVALFVIVGDHQGLLHDGEPRAVVDDADEGSAEWVDGLVCRELKAAKAGRGAVSLDGRLIDIASIRMAEALIEKADAMR